MEKIFIVDAVNILFRSYFAIGPMTNPKGESTNALYGFIRSIQKVIKDFSPKHFIAVFDGPDNKTKRTKIFEGYKKHREKMPPDLFQQLERAIEFCNLAGIPTLSVPGVEADDTIGTIARWAEKKGAKVYICSSDKDLCQLVSKHVFIVHLHKDNLVIDEAKVKEMFGVNPNQIVDLLAIMGDTSDNIPGLEGFGPKTASALLNEFGTLDALLAHPEKVPGAKKQEILKRDKEIALMSRQLAELDYTVEFPHEEKFFQLKPHEDAEIRAFYQEMHFLSLLKDLGGEKPKIEHEADEKVHYQLVNTLEELEELVSSLKKEKEICIDTETTSIRPLEAEIVGIGLSAHPKHASYIPFNGSLEPNQILECLKPLLENPHIGFYGHNIKYDLHVLQNVGIEIKNISFDTLLASYLLNPQNTRHNLDTLALEKLGKTKISIDSLIGKGKTQVTMREAPIDKVASYCCEDVDYTARLKKLFEKEIEAAGLGNVLEKIELPLLPVLARMERAGIFVDTEKLHKMSKELAHSIEVLEKKIFHMAGETFNISSPKQLSVILFEKMGIKPPKKTATGFSTSADVLESLKDEAPIVHEILEYRTLEKLRSTYVDSLPLQINPRTHRIHCTFNQSVAATGRLSSQDPNLQNIPIRTTAGRKIREAFKPEKPHSSFLSADYSQIELRLLAHLSEDPVLIKAFLDGEDVHAYTASLVFDTPLREVTPEMRYRAKAVNFGILYGQQAFGLSETLGIDYKEAASFIEKYFERYKKVKEYLEFCKEAVRKTGRAVTLTGRQRPIPEITSKNPMIRAAAERLAVNTPLQGTAADLIKIAMIDIDAKLQEKSEWGTMILQIHDELLFESPDHEIEALSSYVKKTMEGVFKLKVPLVVDICIGKNWGEC